jgi:hypothetical protein
VLERAVSHLLRHTRPQVTVFFAYIIAGSFMDVFDLTVDSVLVCYLTVRVPCLRRGHGLASITTHRSRHVRN